MVRCPLRINGRWIARILLLACVVPLCAATDEADYAKARKALLADIQRDAAATANSTGRPRFSESVIGAMDSVPRHRFVPASEMRRAYENRPLPIGYGQTISQPYIVALMTELLEPEADDVMLEVGTGSGYQAAVLSRLVERVHTIEIVEPLGRNAGDRLRRLGFLNVEVKFADGYHGWPEHAPYDGIIVTAASNAIPPPLIQQLKPGGRMVIPVGAPFFTQNLILLEKDAKGNVSTTTVLPVAFVPLTGER